MSSTIYDRKRGQVGKLHVGKQNFERVSKGQRTQTPADGHHRGGGSWVFGRLPAAYNHACLVPETRKPQLVQAALRLGFTPSLP